MREEVIYREDSEAPAWIVRSGLQFNRDLGEISPCYSYSRGNCYCFRFSRLYTGQVALCCLHSTPSPAPQLQGLSCLIDLVFAMPARRLARSRAARALTRCACWRLCCSMAAPSCSAVAPTVRAVSAHSSGALGCCCMDSTMRSMHVLSLMAVSPNRYASNRGVSAPPLSSPRCLRPVRRV